MGVSVSREYVDKYNKKRRKSGRGSILIVGLDGAGKSTIAYQLALGKHVDTLPTMGHNKQTMTHWGRKWDLFDVGGSMLIRETWRLYARAADGIIFVVDSSDTIRMAEAGAALRNLYMGDGQSSEHHGAKSAVLNIPLLILANKQDRPGAVPFSKIEKRMDVKAMPVKKLVLPSNGRTGESLNAGVMWLTEQIDEMS